MSSIRLKLPYLDPTGITIAFAVEVHRSHFSSSVFVALSDSNQVRMEIMAIRKVNTSCGDSIARTHIPSFE
jgi:hypothetical protein